MTEESIPCPPVKTHEVFTTFLCVSCRRRFRTAAIMLRQLTLLLLGATMVLSQRRLALPDPRSCSNSKCQYIWQIAVFSTSSADSGFPRNCTRSMQHAHLLNPKLDSMMECSADAATRWPTQARSPPACCSGGSYTSRATCCLSLPQTRRDLSPTKRWI
jgi:hypothetical protein